MNTELNLSEIKKEWHGSLKGYIIGFIGCLLLTATSFLLVSFQILSGQTLIYTISGLAFVQAIVQLLFFLHVGQEAKPRWETYTFFLMLFILLIIVVGSLWVMNDLNHRVMPMMNHSSHE